ncbi:MAG: PA4642 family protein [Halieaceae bacterium]|jgi:hypothetical protein|nr:PA4642 family protein [Halieaceae bacterium]
MRKDKEKVLDEVWTEARVKSFLQIRSHDDVEEDFHMLLKAYQSMRAEDFAKFVGFFVDDGRNLDATNPAGKTVLDIVSQHRRSDAYAEILQQAGATRR